MRVRLLLFIVLVMTAAQSAAQVAITALPYLEINNIAQSEALAGADVADWNSVSGLHLNPALLGGDESVIFSTPFYFEDGLRAGTDWLPEFRSGLKLQTPFVVVNFENFSIGFKHKRFIHNQFITPEDSPVVIGSFESEEVSNSLVASLQVSENSKIGLSYNWFKSDLYAGSTVGGIGRVVAKGSSFDIGVVHRFPTETNYFFITPSVALAINDIGRAINYGFGEEALPTTIRAGFGVNFQSKNEISGLSTVSLHTFGALSNKLAGFDEDGNPYDGIQALYKTWKPYRYFNGIEYRELSVKEQLQSHLGIELAFLEILQIRVGRYYEDENNGDRNYISRGFGLHYKFISVDYTRIYDKSEWLNFDMDFYQLTVTIPW